MAFGDLKVAGGDLLEGPGIYYMAHMECLGPVNSETVITQAVPQPSHHRTLIPLSRTVFMVETEALDFRERPFKKWFTCQDPPTGHHLRLLSLQKPPEETCWRVLVVFVV